MTRIRTPEQQARIVATQADFDAIKPYIVLFKEALLDSSKEAEADAMFAGFTEAQKDWARMLVFRLTTGGELRIDAK